MEFWGFMLGMSLLIPITMVGFGSRFAKKAPKKINMVYGYRTPMSMKNNDTWVFAHMYFGRLWCLFGWILLPVSVGFMLLVLGKDVNVIGIFGGVLVIIQSIVIVIPIIPTERALRKKFDEQGERIA